MLLYFIFKTDKCRHFLEKLLNFDDPLDIQITNKYQGILYKQILDRFDCIQCYPSKVSLQKLIRQFVVTNLFIYVLISPYNIIYMYSFLGKNQTRLDQGVSLLNLKHTCTKIISNIINTQFTILFDVFVQCNCSLYRIVWLLQKTH